MATRTVVKLQGFRELEAALAELPKATARNVVLRTLKKAAEPIRAEAETLAPDDLRTGSPDLHTSIVATIKQKSGRQRSYRPISKNYVELYVGPERRQSAKGQFMEFGTFKDVAQPFLTPAWESNKDGALDIIKAELRSEIDRAAARLAKKRAKA